MNKLRFVNMYLICNFLLCLIIYVFDIRPSIRISNSSDTDHNNEHAGRPKLTRAKSIKQ